ncbi:uncharacterized protein BDZ99DRAFT_567504 [Mytilinidion resinicola]|uniref:Uncharacterized protein n=1 Tax=Mytilinidion resinicola TaxID=574789 RepID=A0A6A6YXW1_9PEZI|nr:uncharacterized protein BDZ99DRAFT_567504 [Mytilinidion resinicola]KAF2813762.1 hypothetical protein BDZ99DRAFT_567504 [Mytilinidion resinicola]
MPFIGSTAADRDVIDRDPGDFDSCGGKSGITEDSVVDDSPSQCEDSPAASKKGTSPYAQAVRARKIPHSANEASTQDLLILKMMDAGEPWPKIHAAFENLTHHKPSSAALQKRYKRMKTNFGQASSKLHGVVEPNANPGKGSKGPTANSTHSTRDVISVEVELESENTAVGPTSEVPKGALDFASLAQRFNCYDEESLHSIILIPNFLNPWAEFRDIFLLATSPCGPPYRVTEELERTTFGYIKDVGATPYDWPDEDEVKHWGPLEHYGCVIYKICKTFATKLGPLHNAFRGKNGLEAVQNVAALVHCVEREYYEAFQSKPSDLVRGIEERKPTKIPHLSPIPYVRALERLGGNTTENARHYTLMTTERWLNKSTKKELLRFITDEETLLEEIPIKDLKQFALKVLIRTVEETNDRAVLYDLIEGNPTEVEEMKELALRTLPGRLASVPDKTKLEAFIKEHNLEDEDDGAGMPVISL